MRRLSGRGCTPRSPRQRVVHSLILVQSTIHRPVHFGPIDHSPAHSFWSNRPFHHSPRQVIIIIIIITISRRRRRRRPPACLPRHSALFQMRTLAPPMNDRVTRRVYVYLGRSRASLNLIFYECANETSGWRSLRRGVVAELGARYAGVGRRHHDQPRRRRRRRRRRKFDAGWKGRRRLRR